MSIYTHIIHTTRKYMVKKKLLSDRRTYRQLQSDLHDLPWIINGSVVTVAPKTESANTTYVWTRKVKAKTVTKALTREQYEAFQQAIEANRHVEDTLKRMRQVSEMTLLNSLPGVTKKPRAVTADKVRNSRANPS